MADKNLTEKKTDLVAEMTENGNFVVAREPIKGANGKQLQTQDGRLYFAYILYGKLQGRSVKIDFSPKDKGGYQPLDLVFSVSSKAELLISDVVQEMNGVKSHRTVYHVSAVDKDGLVWKCEVKPTRTSDRDMLAMLINLIGAKMHSEAVDETKTA